MGSVLPADGGHAVRRRRQIKSRRHELLDLSEVDGAVARRRRRRRVAPDVTDALLVDLVATNTKQLQRLKSSYNGHTEDIIDALLVYLV